MNELLTIKEVCEKAKLSRTTLHQLVKSGKLKCLKIGRSVRFRPEDIASFLETVGM